jgi:hypothetical protein
MNRQLRVGARPSLHLDLRVNFLMHLSEGVVNFPMDLCPQLQSNLSELFRHLLRPKHLSRRRQNQVDKKHKMAY